MQRVLEVAGDEIAISMHLDTVPTGVGNQDGPDSFRDGVIIRWHVDFQ